MQAYLSLPFIFETEGVRYVEMYNKHIYNQINITYFVSRHFHIILTVFPSTTL